MPGRANVWPGCRRIAGGPGLVLWMDLPGEAGLCAAFPGQGQRRQGGGQQPPGPPMPASVAGGRRKIRGPGNLGFGPRLVPVPRIGTIRLGGIGIDKPHRLPIVCQCPRRLIPLLGLAVVHRNRGSIRLLLGLRLGYRIACAFGQAQDGQAFLTPFRYLLSLFDTN